MLSWHGCVKSAIISGAAVLVLFLGFVVADRLAPLPLPKESGFAQVVLDDQGQPLRVFPDEKGVWRYPVAVHEVSDRYIEALLTYEDRWFYQHPGINPLALVRAMVQWAEYGRPVSGGSTLTMQVARILDPHTRSLTGKIKQMFRALQLEWHFSKTEILQFYLNYAPFGGTLEGVQAASFAYFGKSASQLRHSEAALLAVLPQRPSALRPDRYPELATQARNKVLQRLLTFDVWQAQDVMEAIEEPLTAFYYSRPNDAPLLAERLVNATPNRAVIQTSINRSLQQKFAQLTRHYVSRFDDHTSAAVLLLNNSDLSVVAYLGTAVFADQSRSGYLDMIRAVRSPGSTLKPLLYGLALDEGIIHQQSLLFDVPMNFDGYRPRNFDAQYSGPVSMREALRRSLNIPAVHVLKELGPNRYYARLASAGLRLSLPKGTRPNLSLALGGNGVTLEALVGTFASLGRAGLAGAPRLRRDTSLDERPLLSSGAAWIIQESLRSYLDGNGALNRQRAHRQAPVAYKTGTSYGQRDAWAVAVSQQYTLGVWVGRPDGTARPHNTGRLAAVPLLSQLISVTPADAWLPPERPSNVIRESICWPFGGIEALQDPSNCHQTQVAWLLDGTAPSTLEDPTLTASQGLIRSGCHGSQRHSAVWPPVLRPWLAKRMWASDLQNCSEDVGTLQIAGILPGAKLAPLPGRLALPPVFVQVTGATGNINWFLDGRFEHQVPADRPWSLAGLGNGSHRLSATDGLGRMAEIEFRVSGVSDRQ